MMRSITLITKSGKDIKIKERYRAMFLIKIAVKYLNKILGNQT
jgi:hypothetical protein